MNKQQIDQQLIEACILEKWNPRAMGCSVPGNDTDTCCLCQVYYPESAIDDYDEIAEDEDDDCLECPIRLRTGARYCRDTPFVHASVWNHEVKEWQPTKNHNIVEAEIEFLISLLPPDHPWRTL